MAERLQEQHFVEAFIFMSGYVPRWKEYSEVRAKLREIFEDYVFLYMTRGVQHTVDVYRDPADLDRRAQEALENAKYLDGLLQRMHTLVTTDPRALGDEWPGILDVLKSYTYHHQFIKEVRPLAKLWGIDARQAADRVNLGGQPPTYELEEFLERASQVVATLRRRGEDVTQKRVAERLFSKQPHGQYYHRDMMRSYYGRLTGAGFPVRDFASLITFIDQN